MPADLTVRSATPHKYMRLAWSDGSAVVLGFLKKGTAKSSVAVQHTKLPDRAAVRQMKAFWGERLAALGNLLA